MANRAPFGLSAPYSRVPFSASSPCALSVPCHPYPRARKQSMQRRRNRSRRVWRLQNLAPSSARRGWLGARVSGCSVIERSSVEKETNPTAPKNKKSHTNTTTQSESAAMWGLWGALMSHGHEKPELAHVCCCCCSCQRCREVFCSEQTVLIFLFCFLHHEQLFSFRAAVRRGVL